MLTSDGSGATVEPTPGDDQLPEETILKTVTELACRWHRNFPRSQKDPFVAGMCNGWVQAISLLLGADSQSVLRALELGKL